MKKDASMSLSHLMKMKFPQARGIIGGGVLNAGGNLILAGEGGIGKSLMTLELSLRLIKGEPFIGLPVARVGGVLFLQSENPPSEIKERTNRMLKGLKYSKAPKEIYFSRPGLQYNLGKKGDTDKIISEVQRTKAEVLIIDPFIDFHTEDENENTPMRRILKRLNRIKHKAHVAVILVHHFSKAADRKGQYRLRGASTIFDWADTVIELSGKGHGNERTVKFLKTKFGKRREDIHLLRDQNFIHQVVEEKSKCTTKDVVTVLKKKFSGACDKKGQLVNALTKKTNCSESTASKAIRKALKEGKIREERKGKKKSVKLV